MQFYLVITSLSLPKATFDDYSDEYFKKDELLFLWVYDLIIAIDYLCYNYLV